MKMAMKIVLILFFGFYSGISFCQDTTINTFKINKTIYATVAGKTSGTISRQMVLDSAKVVLHGCTNCKISGFEMLAIKYARKPGHAIMAIKRRYNTKTGNLLSSDTSFSDHKEKWDSNEDRKLWPYEINKRYNKNSGELLTVTKSDRPMLNPNDSAKCWAHLLVVKNSNNKTGEYVVDSTDIYQQYNMHFQAYSEYFTPDMIKAIGNELDIKVSGIVIYNLRITTPENQERMMYTNRFFTLYLQ